MFRVYDHFADVGDGTPTSGTRDVALYSCDVTGDVYPAMDSLDVSPSQPTST